MKFSDLVVDHGADAQVADDDLKTNENEHDCIHCPLQG